MTIRTARTRSGGDLGTILVVDDEELIRWSLGEALRGAGYHSVEAGSLREARTRLEALNPDLVILDIRIPDGSGLDYLRELRLHDADLPVVMITGHGNVQTAVQATQAGATAYLPKPFDVQEMLLVVGRALADAGQRRELRILRERSSTQGYESIVGQSAAMADLIALLRRLEDADAQTVLLLGESGTGKDLVARAIHQRSRRSTEPFLEIDCAGLSDQLIQSELFGHERGAFTDAKERKAGLFEVAGRGSLFLDEIGEMSMNTQSKLLRALENRRFKRVGGTTDISLRARVIAATNRDLAAEVEAGNFRRDLYYRLSVIPIVVPRLVDRRGDVPLLVEHFVRKCAREMGRPAPSVEPAAVALLDSYAWPGNVRELRNVIERAVVLCRGGAILAADLPVEIARAGGVRAGHGSIFTLPEEGIDLAALEDDLVRQAMERAAGNQSQAARLLGLGRFALRYRLEKLGLLKGSEAGADR